MAYTGNVVSGLPDWNPDISVIAEPPNDKKLTGWQPDEKPPAQWFNWLNAGFYKSIKEIDDLFSKTSGHGHTGVDGDGPKLDPTKAFTYTPVNNAGDTMTGDLVMGGRNIRIRRSPGAGDWAKSFIIEDTDGSRMISLGSYGSSGDVVSYHYLGRVFNDTFMRFYEDRGVTIDGNLGIGTVNPLSKISIKNVGATNDVNLMTFSENETETFVLKGMFEGAGEVENSIKLTSVWKNNVMVWRGDGKVGIGMANPLYSLDLNGEARVYSVLPDKEDMLILDKHIMWSAALNKHQNIVWRNLQGNMAAIGAKYDGANVSIDFHSMLNNNATKSDSDIAMSIKGDGVVSTNFGKLILRYNHIENHYTDDTGRIVVNYRGYQGGTSHFRDFLVYNGKTETIANFVGSDKSVKFYGSVEIFDGLTCRGAGSFSSSGGAALSLLPGSDDHSYLQFFPRSATPDTRGGFIGYGSVGTTTMSIKNETGNIEVIANGGIIDIGGSIVATGDIKSKGVKVFPSDGSYPMTGDLIMEGHNIKIRRPSISGGGWARSFVVEDRDESGLISLGSCGNVIDDINAISYHYLGRAYNDTFMRFYEDKRVTIDGYLGIGTVNPLGKIGIQNVGSVDDVTLMTFAEGDGDTFALKGMFAGTGGEGNSINLQTTWADNVMVWCGDGKVGIGMSNPQYQLDVNGNARFYGVDTYTTVAIESKLAYQNSLVFKRDGVNRWNLRQKENEYNLNLHNYNLAEDIVTFDYHMGNVGIQKSDPTYPLDVGGQIRSYSELADKEDMIILHKGIAWQSALNKHQSIVWQNPYGDMAAIGAKYDDTNVSIDFHSLYSNGYKTDSNISFSVFGSGERPILVDSTVGSVSIGVASVGGWATEHSFERLGGASFGGFGARGTGDTLNYYYIGMESDNPLLKVTPEGHMVVKGTGSFGAGAGTLSLLPGGNDHTYLQFFPRSAEPNSRGGYLGYGSAGTTTMALRNEIGNIELSPHGGTVNVNGNLSVAGTGVKVVSVLAGKIEHDHYIPLPSGYNESQCKWLVSSRGASGSPVYSFQCDTVGRKVKSSYRYMKANDTGGHNLTTVYTSANYIIIGIK